jgi:hypothetical protein
MLSPLWLYYPDATQTQRRPPPPNPGNVVQGAELAGLRRRSSLTSWIEDAAAWYIDEQVVRNDANPLLGSGDADIVRASELQHAIEDIDRHVDFGHPRFVYT